MKKFALYALAIGLCGIYNGCGKPYEPTRSASAPTHAEQNDRGIEQDEHAIELQAQQAKRTIDSITAEAEDALHRTHEDLKADAQQQVRQTAAAAAAAAEAAKDRAEDVPEEVDSVLERAARRVRIEEESDSR